MGVLKWIFFIIIGVALLIITKFITHPVKAPVLEEKYWGPGSPPLVSRKTVSQIEITFTTEAINDLRYRLGNTRYTPPLEGIAQEYGFNTDLLKEIVDFWQNNYDFKQREAYLNKYPHFKTNIQGLDMHFVHVKPKDTAGLTVLPLLLLHGWPGSVREFYELIPFLTTRNPKHNFVFEVIAPSLPGFGYSQAPAKPGCGAVEMAVIMKNLMLRLGHSKFYIQGGDWGSMIASYLAAVYKDHVLGVHCNMCLVSTPLAWIKRFAGVLYPPAIVDKKYQDRYYPLGSWFRNMLAESGYYHIQATKPDTVGVGLNDSPAGLAAYILEKFTTLTDPAYQKRIDGGLHKDFRYENLLDNIMIYWITNTMTSGMRIYAESRRSDIQRVPIEVPSACANFRHELFYTPEAVLRDRYVNLVQNTHYDFGGHFIAMQMPDILAADIFSAVEKMVLQQVNDYSFEKDL
ncbi:juvenile hormone epoxide hydrolase 2-like [Atheta coriaria]|uniref:juvenile hormone epoxide hydrolase 2-like n=1 Tax=Dalotia coriaria TaxID=877792 RepID=UPI0031F4232F